MSEYSINIVGESHHQTAIRRCRPGELVRLRKEADNPYDQNAVAVECPRGQTLGYLSRECFLQRLIWEENKPIEAQIERLKRATGAASTGVVLRVQTTGVTTNSVYSGAFRPQFISRKRSTLHGAEKSSLFSKLLRML